MIFTGDTPWLAEGSVIERLSRDSTIALDPHVEHAALIESEVGRTALTRIYRGYLDAGRDHGLNMLILSPTWRASGERCLAAGYASPDTLNGGGVRFLREICAGYGAFAERIKIAGLTGCRGDAYDPRDALSPNHAIANHSPQIEALTRAGVDILFAATLPAFTEALGIAHAMAASGLPYTLGFVLRPSGTLLDGRPLHEVVAEIDSTVDPAPIGYLANCVHPENYAAAIACEIGHGLAPERLLGLQANTSKRSPEELEGAEELETTAPESFADAMIAVGRRFGLRILGGCCGTDETHIRALAARLSGGI